MCATFIIIVEPTYFNATSFMSSSEYFTHTSLVMYTVCKKKTGEGKQCIEFLSFSSQMDL